MINKIKNKFTIWFWMAFAFLSNPLVVFACDENEVKVGGWWFFGGRCYAKPSLKKFGEVKAEGKTFDYNGNCSTKFAGMEIKDGKMTFRVPCDSNRTFDNYMDKTANVFSEVRSTVLWICVIIAIVCLVLGAIQLAAARGNPQRTQKAWGRIKTSIAVIAVIGGITTIVTWAFSLFN